MPTTVANPVPRPELAGIIGQHVIHTTPTGGSTSYR
jgi:hypothetical protein